MIFKLKTAEWGLGKTTRTLFSSLFLSFVPFFSFSTVGLAAVNANFFWIVSYGIELSPIHFFVIITVIIIILSLNSCKSGPPD